jgi:hypothetical protein
MTPKEKAKELFYKFWEVQEPKHKIAKKYALIAVDEILRSHHNLYGLNNKEVQFYLEVQQEIKKL